MRHKLKEKGNQTHFEKVLTINILLLSFLNEGKYNHL